MTYCSVYQISLCSTVLLNQSETCFEKWYNCQNLNEAHDEKYEVFVSGQESSRFTGRYQQAINVRRHLEMNDTVDDGLKFEDDEAIIELEGESIEAVQSRLVDENLDKNSESKRLR